MKTRPLREKHAAATLLCDVYRSLQFSICNSSYSNLNLRPKRVKCPEDIYSGRHRVAVLPNGYNIKEIIFHLLPALLQDKFIREETPSVM